MILVDTSVLIDYLRGMNNRVTDKFQFILDSDIPFGINSLIYQEVLQGAKTENEFRELKKYLETQIFYDIKDKKTSFENAALIYFRCRKKGRQIGSTIACLIAWTAIENNLFLLHDDKDFEKIATVSELKIY